MQGWLDWRRVSFVRQLVGAWQAWWSSRANALTSTHTCLRPCSLVSPISGRAGVQRCLQMRPNSRKLSSAFRAGCCWDCAGLAPWPPHVAAAQSVHRHGLLARGMPLQRHFPWAFQQLVAAALQSCCLHCCHPALFSIIDNAGSLGGCSLLPITHPTRPVQDFVALKEKYGDKGLVIMAFPCNQVCSAANGKTVHLVRAWLPLQAAQPTALCNSARPSSACSSPPQFGFQEPGTNEEIKKFASDRGFTGGRHGRAGLESNA